MKTVVGTYDNIQTAYAVANDLISAGYSRNDISVVAHDPNNEYSVPYLWGTTGIGYNEDKFKKVFGNAQPDSWNYIFDPKNAAKLKDCGISLLDASDEILKIVLAWIGRDPNSQKEEDLKAAEEKLMPGALQGYIYAEDGVP